jgi:dTDP-4-dehydrorhamnose reductase
MTNVDKCEINRDLAWSINVQGTENIAEKCAEVDANGVDPSTMRTLENKHLLRGVSYAT